MFFPFTPAWMVSTYMAFTLLLLTGCSSQVPVVQKEYILVKVPAHLVTKVEVPTPPQKEEFLMRDIPKGERDGKRLALSIKLNQELYGAIETCNNRLVKISDFLLTAEKEVEAMKGMKK